MRKFPFGEYLSVFAMLLMCVGVAIPSCSKEESPSLTTEDVCDESEADFISDLKLALEAYRSAKTEACRNQGRKYLLEYMSDSFGLWESAYHVAVERPGESDNQTFLSRMLTTANTPARWMLYAYYVPSWQPIGLARIADTGLSTMQLQDALLEVRAAAYRYSINDWVSFEKPTSIDGMEYLFVHSNNRPKLIDMERWKINGRTFDRAVFAAMKSQARTAVDWTAIYVVTDQLAWQNVAVSQAINLAEQDRYDGYVTVVEYLDERYRGGHDSLWALAAAGMKKHAVTFDQYRGYIDLMDSYGEVLSGQSRHQALKSMTMLAVNLNDWMNVYRLSPVDSETRKMAKQAIVHRVRIYDDLGALIDIGDEIAETDEDSASFSNLYVLIADKLIDKMATQPSAEKTE